MKKESNLAKNAILNTIKQCCVIIFPLITFPYVSRVLGTVNYGKINFGQSIISYITLIASLGIAQYAIREGAKERDNKSDLNIIVNEIFTINILSTLLAFFVFGIMLFFWPKLFDYRILLLVQVSVVLFSTLGTDWINSIFEDYRILTIRYIFFHGIAIVFMFLLVKNSDDYIIYAGITVLSSIIPNILNIHYIKKQYGISVRLVNLQTIKRHLMPITILFASSIASLIYINSDVTILGILKNDYDVGLYSVSAKIYSLVKQLINAFLYVAIPKISNELKSGLKKEAEKQLNSILGVLLSLSLPASTGVYVLSENIVRLVSGNEYIEATSSLKILAIALYFSTLACFYINVVLLPLGKEKIILRATVISAICNIVLNVILIPFMGRDAAAITTVIAEITMVFFGIKYTKKDYWFKISKPLISGLLSAFGVVICYLLTKEMVDDYILQLIICMIMSVSIFAVVMFAFNRTEFKTLIKAIKK